MVINESYDTIVFLCYGIVLFFGGYMLFDITLKKFFGIDMDRN